MSFNHRATTFAALDAGTSASWSFHQYFLRVYCCSGKIHNQLSHSNVSVSGLRVRHAAIATFPREAGRPWRHISQRRSQRRSQRSKKKKSPTTKEKKRQGKKRSQSENRNCRCTPGATPFCLEPHDVIWTLKLNGPGTVPFTLTTLM